MLHLLCCDRLAEELVAATQKSEAAADALAAIAALQKEAAEAQAK